MSPFVTTTPTVSSVASGSSFHWVFWTEAFHVLPPAFVPTVPPHCFLVFLVSIETAAPVGKFVPVTVPSPVPVFVNLGKLAPESVGCAIEMPSHSSS
jgi:hypothetical protein